MDTVMRKRTRSYYAKCPIFQDSRMLPENQLPTYKDVILAIFHLKSDHKFESKKDPSTRDIVKVIVKTIVNIYSQERMPIINKKSISGRIESFHCKYQNLLKPIKKRRGTVEHYDKELKLKSKLQNVGARILFSGIVL